METKMLRWTAGITRLDRIRNYTVQDRFGVAPVAEKMHEARLRWYSHDLRGKDYSVRMQLNKTVVKLLGPGLILVGIPTLSIEERDGVRQTRPSTAILEAKQFGLKEPRAGVQI
ncbi:hypothetical protein TELCIR_14704 [Teladorsagia circumcincta]|uniref:Uncharacterized protein n=1 Tax=Teladorsagia circumcincta TaxID=45464 RepID=A0A2G9U084_TELCI|nr:hypothetical protein TELCIR_14704 [Teladorsagia circumcincta]